MRDVQMNFQKIVSLIKQNIFFYLIGFCIIIGIKLFCRNAGSDELRWLLAPVTGLVSLFSGIPFVYEQNAGYVNHSLRLLIAPSCSGIQFMNIMIATLIFSFVHRVEKRKKILFTAACIPVSYVLTILVNGMRIILAIYIPRFMESQNIYIRFLPPETLHTVIGTFVYFISLLAIYRIAGYLFSKSNYSKCISPAFWYFFIVLGIPFLNRAYQKSGGQFIEYAILITSVCLPVLLIFALLGLARRLLS